VTSVSDDERAIRSVVDTWMNASRAGDLATVLSLMADDAIFMVPGQEPFGKAAFAANSSAMKDVRIDGRSEIVELQVLGQWAFLRNHIDLTMSREGAPSVRRSGFTLTILRKEGDGRWLLVRDANLLALRS
jgi:uncharacterized protein (TIGR02246 family)